MLQVSSFLGETPRADLRPKPDSFSWLKEKTAKSESQIKEKGRGTPKQLLLPSFDIGGFPNHINRSSLISPIARGKRKFHRQAEMVTRRDCVLQYTGEQLDEADGDLIMALIAFAQPFSIGTSVPLNRAELLRKLKKSNGKQQYEWLHRRIKSLTEASLFLEAKKPDGSIRYSIGKTESFRIVAGFSYNSETEQYSYSLDPSWVKMFSNREYSLIDWDKRMQIRRGQDMAKTLQRLVATSSDTVQRYALDWLKAKMDYNSPMRKFRDALGAACTELERLEIIATSRVEDSTRAKQQLVLWLIPSV